MCRNKAEHWLVKGAAEKIRASTRVLRDKLYLIKVNNVKRTAVLNKFNIIKVRAAKTFSKKNKTTVAKIA